MIYPEFFQSRRSSRFLPGLIGLIILWASAQSGCTDKKRIEMVRVDHLQSISASSSDPSFPPSLLLDDTPGPEKAWHSATRPTFPQWIQVEYPEPVVLDKMALQAQYTPPNGPTNNRLRAPRAVEVWGASDSTFRTYEKIAAWECSYEKDGSWCLKDLSASSRKYAFYRLVILNNHGDPDYVTLQEMNFFSHE